MLFTTLDARIGPRSFINYGAVHTECYATFSEYCKTLELFLLKMKSELK